MAPQSLSAALVRDTHEELALATVISDANDWIGAMPSDSTSSGGDGVENDWM